MDSVTLSVEELPLGVTARVFKIGIKSETKKC